MTSKNMTLRRVLIYLAFAFALPWIMQLTYIVKFGCDVNTMYYHLIISLSMLCPAIASIITRLITKEGLKDSFLKVNLKGHIKYYIFSLIIPVGYAVVGALITAIFYMPSGTLSEIANNIDILDVITTIIYLLSLATLSSIPALGEELGWRGYLTPKLEELTNTPCALLISGIIWGLWHAPVTIIGHNFGTDYKFYPYLGILLMCVFCTFMGSFLTYLTKKTGSVYPAALAHAANNDTVTVISTVILMCSANYTEEYVKSCGLLQNVITGMGPVFVLGLITFVLLIFKNKNKTNTLSV